MQGPEPEFRNRTDIYRRALRTARNIVRLQRKVRTARVWCWLVLTAIVLSVSSCRRAVERAQRNIRVEAVEQVERQGSVGAVVTLRVKNDTRYKLRLNAARFDVYLGGGHVVSVLLRERVEVPRRTTDRYRTLWRLKVSDPMAFYALGRKIRSGDLSQVAIAYAIEGRGGPAPVKISGERMPMSDFLNTFGLTIQDIEIYFEE